MAVLCEGDSIYPSFLLRSGTWAHGPCMGHARPNPYPLYPRPWSPSAPPRSQTKSLAPGPPPALPVPGRRALQRDHRWLPRGPSVRHLHHQLLRIHTKQLCGQVGGGGVPDPRTISSCASAVWASRWGGGCQTLEASAPAHSHKTAVRASRCVCVCGGQILK